jgi:hypothetical protein
MAESKDKSKKTCSSIRNGLAPTKSKGAKGLDKILCSGYLSWARDGTKLASGIQNLGSQNRVANNIYKVDKQSNMIENRALGMCRFWMEAGRRNLDHSNRASSHR